MTPSRMYIVTARTSRRELLTQSVIGAAFVSTAQSATPRLPPQRPRLSPTTHPQHDSGLARGRK